ncbi:MAG: YcxB family protein [Clostridia bacterium]|nr:YcxB family protein [Clostridia bacterium]
MRIRASVQHNFETSKALAYITAFKKYNPKKRFIFLTVLRLVLLLVVVFELAILLYFESAYGIVYNFKWFMILFIIISLWLIASGFWVYYFFPKIQYNSMLKMKNFRDEYFFSDEAFIDTVSNEEYNERTEIRYSMLFKVYETSQYFFIFRNKIEAYVVDKSTIEGGTAEDIRNKLSEVLKDKYYICNY